MNIVVCMKQTPNTEAKIVVKPGGQDIEKDNIMKSFNIIELDYYNRNILEKINNKYDGEPLVVICYDILYKL